MPIAALINSDVLCVHGGLGPNFETVGQLRAIAKPIADFSEGIIDAVFWSDPTTDLGGIRKSVVRTRGYEFGAVAVREFLEANNLRLLVRGHSALLEGIRYQFDNKVVTVFSASNYCNQNPNLAAVLEVRRGGSEISHTFGPLPFVTRKCRESGERYVPGKHVVLSLQSNASAKKPPIVVKAIRQSVGRHVMSKTPEPRSRGRPIATGALGSEGH
jgi:diadenosine tetraphosphatase ApaH/serine/threonine PP2A family protein phosphatase